jgi:hypothetical protein
VGHVAASEPTLVGRRDPESWNTWQCWSLPQPGGEVQSHRTCGSVGAHLCEKVRSGAIGHVAALEPTSVEGEVRSHRICDNARAHPSWEVRSEAIRHVTVPEPTLTGR